MDREDLRPLQIITRQALVNAIRVNTAIGGSTNCPPHLLAIARHAGVELSIEDWEAEGYDLPLIVNLQPAGDRLGEDFYRAGGLPTVMRELVAGGLIDGNALTVTGRGIAENVAKAPTPDGDVIRPLSNPLRHQAGFLVLSGNLFEAALIKTSVISDEFRARYLKRPGQEGSFECKAVVYEGPEDYHDRINDPALKIDENSLLVIRGCGPVGYPGSAEVVNMQPPDALIRAGIRELPTLGDGRQSGTSASPSILNASPEALLGGGLAKLRTGDRVRIDLVNRRVDALVPQEEWAARENVVASHLPKTATPWQEIYRNNVGQLHTGGCLDFACDYRDVCKTVPRPTH